MQTTTTNMSAEQLRKLLSTVPKTAHVEMTTTTVRVSATRKGASAPETVITAKQVGTQWEVTAPVGLIQAV